MKAFQYQGTRMQPVPSRELTSGGGGGVWLNLPENIKISHFT